MDNINLEMLVAVEQLIDKPEDVFEIVEKYEKAVILKNNKPSYVLTKYKESDRSVSNKRVIAPSYTLHEAMQIVLSEQPNKTMRAVDLADEIYNRGLYRKKDGTKAKVNQIRARSENYKNMFEVQSPNIIKLK
jgi:antitoxin Phd